MISIKVCGMRDPENIGQVVYAGADIIGFIFFSGSKRYVGENPDNTLFSRIPETVKKAGVFVNEVPEKICMLSGKCKLDLIQLHGTESPHVCEALRYTGLQVIKAIGISDRSDFRTLDAYKDSCDFFLFDTASVQYGGTGVKFDWKILNDYQLQVPFFLSGGIALDDTVRILELNHPSFFGVDINSRFEISPGLKDAQLVGEFITKIRQFKYTDQ